MCFIISNYVSYTNTLPHHLAICQLNSMMNQEFCQLLYHESLSILAHKTGGMLICKLSLLPSEVGANPSLCGSRPREKPASPAQVKSVTFCTLPPKLVGTTCHVRIACMQDQDTRSVEVQRYVHPARSAVEYDL